MQARCVEEKEKKRGWAEGGGIVWWGLESMERINCLLLETGNWKQREAQQGTPAVFRSQRSATDRSSRRQPGPPGGCVQREMLRSACCRTESN